MFPFMGTSLSAEREDVSDLINKGVESSMEEFSS
jgi:hypothetical protein